MSAATKLKVLSVSERMTNSADLRSPRVSSSSSSSAMRSRSSAMSKGARRAPQLIKMDFRVLPETSCQGLFNQIHKKATKKCQKQILAPDTFADGLFAPV